jgi:DNA-binding NtrC family response regulator
VVHRFSGESLTLGKDAGNDVVLDDRFVSAKHLRLVRKGGSFQVLDRQSMNGTFLGSVRLMEAEVPLRTVLRLGETEVCLEPANEPRAATQHLGMVGNDPSFRALLDLIERVAPSNAAVAVLGESGTGKELVAQALHQRSPRATHAFIPVNCAAISKELIESELFGHEKGAFTGATNVRKGAFEEADGGTLFLDEVGELPLDLQAKLLRALESGEIKRVGASRPLHVDVRIVAATNRDLLAAAREGRFREDLYYRLCVVPLHLPPLRSRRADIPALAEHFVRLFQPRGQSIRFTPDALERLKLHQWPGNIRELRNVVHRALLLRKGPMIDVDDLSYDTERSAESSEPTGEHTPGMTLETMLERAERRIVEAALRKYGNNRERVARELGVARSTLFKRLKDWGLTRQDEPPPDEGRSQ